MTDEKSNSGRTLLSEGVLLALSSSAAYIAGFVFWLNYCVRFGIPITWITLAPGDFLPLTFGLFALGQGAIFAIWGPPPPPLPRGPNSGTMAARVLVQTRMLSLVTVYVGLSLALASLWPIVVPLSLVSCMVSAIIVGGLLLFFRDRRSWEVWAEARLSGLDTTFDPIFRLGAGWSSLVLTIVMLIGFSGALGFAYAHQKRDYQTLNAQTVVLARFGDDFVTAKFDEASHTVCPGLRIIRIEGASTPEMDVKRIGPIQPTYWPPFESPKYPKFCE